MSHRFSIIALGVVVHLFLVAGIADAASNVPPGVSGANQYSETFPGPGGNTSTSGHGPASPARALGNKNAARLEALGPEGREAARLAGETAPVHPSQHLSPSNSSSLKQILGQITGASDEGGMGLLLLLLIAGTTVLAAVYAFSRRRATSPRD